MPKDVLGGSNQEVTKWEFISFVKKAVDKSGPEYRELYFFLVKTFVDGDINRDGSVGPKAFDKMIEAAARAPRRFGLAPSSDQMFGTPAVRLFNETFSQALTSLTCLTGAPSEAQRVLCQNGQKRKRNGIA